MTPAQTSGQDLEIEPFSHLLGRTSVLPVLVIEDEVGARRLAEILVGAGLPVLEVTLRTRAELSALAAMTEVPGAAVDAGTVLRAEDVRHAVDAGAAFCVSPGLTLDLARAAEGAFALIERNQHSWVD